MAVKEKINEQDSGVEIVHGCLTEGGDSILGAFFASACERSYKTSNEFLG